MRIDSIDDAVRKNPFQLTRKQHVLPKASIEMYCGQDGAVDCFIVSAQSRRRLRAANPIFCANQAWSQMAESGPMTKQIEQDFNGLARGLTSDHSARLDSAGHLVVTKFFRL